MPTEYSAGDVVLVDVPYTDLSLTKKRPAAVLLGYDEDCLVAFMTSRINRADAEDVIVAANQRNGLAVDSAVLIHKLFTLHNSLIVRKLGALDTETHRLLITRLTELLNAALPPT